MENQIKGKILEYLSRVTDKWAYSAEIAEQIGNNRVTVSKYLEILLAQKLVQMRVLGKAKLWSLTEPQKPSILIVDDEPHIVQLIKLSLGTQSYELFEAHDGAQGVKEALSITPDVIILDIMMPNMDGFQVCEQLKNHISTQTIPIIFLTAKQEIVDRIKGISMGADHFLTKPFDPAELDAVVSNVLKKRLGIQQRHPTTGLPTKMQLQRFIKTNDFANKEIILAKLENLESIQNIYGYKKEIEVLQLFGKMLSHELRDYPSKDVFVSHYAPTQFAVVLPKKTNYARNITQYFADTVPFFYPQKEITEEKGEVFVKSKGKFKPAVKIVTSSIEVKELKKMLDNVD